MKLLIEQNLVCVAVKARSAQEIADKLGGVRVGYVYRTLQRADIMSEVVHLSEMAKRNHWRKCCKAFAKVDYEGSVRMVRELTVLFEAWAPLWLQKKADEALAAVLPAALVDQTLDREARNYEKRLL